MVYSLIKIGGISTANATMMPPGSRLFHPLATEFVVDAPWSSPVLRPTAGGRRCRGCRRRPSCSHWADRNRRRRRRRRPARLRLIRAGQHHRGHGAAVCGIAVIIVARAAVVCVGYISARHVSEDPVRDVAAGARNRREHERFQPRSNRADFEPESNARVGGAGRRTGVVGVEGEFDVGAAAR
jgi:hypothetical protein